VTLGHVVYIPFLLVLGFFAGWHFGGQTVRKEWDKAERKRRAKDEGLA
jgi:hypothetical protein